MRNEELRAEDLQTQFVYLMENEEEIFRLEQKTDFQSLQKHALWAGLKHGMRVLDVGCGSGITSYMLKSLVGPEGEVIGIDASASRITHAIENYSAPGIYFIQKDIYSNINSLGTFDFIWVRFFLEYHAHQAHNIIKSLSLLLKPDGILCLIDLDNNSTGHYQMPDRMQKAISDLSELIQLNHNFDPCIGRKLYTYMYESGLKDIDVTVTAHHLIFGHLKEKDLYNWIRKLEVAVARCDYDFPGYHRGYKEFKDEFIQFMSYPGRFTYTPMITCRGVNESKTG